MTDKKPISGPPVTRKKYTPAFKAECVRQVAAGARQTDVARAQGISPALLGRWQRQALEQAVPSSAEREELKRLRAELKRVEIERDMLKKAVTIAQMLEAHFHSLSREQVLVYQYTARCLDAYRPVSGAGRKPQRLPPVANCWPAASADLAARRPTGVYAPCQALRHPPPAG